MEGFIRPEQDTVSVVWGQPSSSLLFPQNIPRANNQHKSMDSQ